MFYLFTTGEKKASDFSPMMNQDTYWKNKISELIRRVTNKEFATRYDIADGNADTTQHATADGMADFSDPLVVMSGYLF